MCHYIEDSIIGVDKCKWNFRIITSGIFRNWRRGWTYKRGLAVWGRKTPSGVQLVASGAMGVFRGFPSSTPPNESAPVIIA